MMLLHNIRSHHPLRFPTLPRIRETRELFAGSKIAFAVGTFSYQVGS